MLNPKNKVFLNQDGTLTCRICGNSKQVAEFHRNRANATGYERVCKPCAREKAAAWRKVNKQNRSHDAEKTANRRARRKALEGAGPSNMVPGWRAALFSYYDNACLKCGSGNRLQADHVQPLSKGGAHRIENMQPLCSYCNGSKHDRYQDYRDGDIFTESKMLRCIQKTPGT